jgi:hypothetical protein
LVLLAQLDTDTINQYTMVCVCCCLRAAAAIAYPLQSMSAALK